MEGLNLQSHRYQTPINIVTGIRLLRLLVGSFAFLLIVIPSAFAYSALETPRLISLSPAITEILFELRAGNRLVDMTNFCNYPEATWTIPHVLADLSILSPAHSAGLAGNTHKYKEANA